jgi:hypothetical protein
MTAKLGCSGPTARSRSPAPTGASKAIHKTLILNGCDHELQSNEQLSAPDAPQRNDLLPDRRLLLGG